MSASPSRQFGKQRLAQWINRIRRYYRGYTPLLIFALFVSGILFWGAFNTALEQTNRMSFCISCHEMEDNVYQEYRHSVHYRNRSGVRATCPDCHVPREWKHMLMRKIGASNELLHSFLGTIDSPEKFRARRLDLARHVWQSMQDSDSRECRNCHHFDAMELSRQRSRSRTVHALSLPRGKTCIDCHKGISHRLPDDYEAYRGGSDEDHEYYEEREIPCQRCHPDMPAVDEEEWD